MKKKLVQKLKKNIPWIFSGIGVFLIAIIISISKSGNVPAVQKQSSEGNIQAGRDLIIQHRDESSRKEITRLELTDVIYERKDQNKGVVDFRLLNTGDKTVTISRVGFKVVGYKVIYPDGVPCPSLPPSAVYGMDISNLKKGDYKEVKVSHYVKADEAERFEIELYASYLTPYVTFVWELEPVITTSLGKIYGKIVKVRFIRTR